MLFISIFVLDLINLIIKKMKKIILVFVLLALVAVGLVVFKTTGHLSNVDIVFMLIILIVVGIGLVWLLKKVINVTKSEKVEDELSKRILEKASSISFYLSLYLWLVISMIGDKISLPFEQTIGCGLIGMALIFLRFGLFTKLKVLKMNNRIKEFRAKFNLTQEELAKKVDVRRETIVFLENNKYNPSLRLAYDITCIFSTTIEDVFIFDKKSST